MNPEAINLVPLAISIGLVVSLLFSEFFGIAAGGMVVPGYLALHLESPLSVAATLLAGLLTFAIVQGMGSFAVIYGRRRTALMILTGYAVGTVIRWALYSYLSADAPTVDVIGYIVPGLIAIWLARQGIIETFATATTAAVVVRLVLILLAAVDFNA
jgi:poly-gamma-glutamate biosynthesis protein PgsC/CapC